jgi:hypothetical protein
MTKILWEGLGRKANLPLEIDNEMLFIAQIMFWFDNTNTKRSTKNTTQCSVCHSAMS